MFTEKCTVSTLKRARVNKYTSKSFSELLGSEKDFSVLGTASRSNHSSYYDITDIVKKNENETEILTITFENNAGCERTVECTSNQMFVTNRGYINPSNFNKTDVFIDETGFVNKLKSIETRVEKGIDLYSIELRYNVTTYVNGIKIK